MFCNQCGTQVEDGIKFCPKCGAGVAAAAPQEAPVAVATQLPMKWYKFVIFFALFASAVVNVVNGFKLLTGAVYGDSAALVYAVFGDLKGLDTIIGIGMLALAAYAIFVRFQLTGYKKAGPKLLLGLYVADVALGLVYIIGINSILPEMVAKNVDVSTLYVSVATSVVCIIANYIYFKKRADLFVK